MIITKGIGLKGLLIWSGQHYLYQLVFMGLIGALYHYDIIHITLPWVIITVIGTAVAFYVGFKNNQAYDRVWEARKVWGGIVNDSRSWGTLVNGFITDMFAAESISKEELHGIKKRLIYRHIGWLYAHRSQLLVSTPWEHRSQGGYVGRKAKYYQKVYGIGLVENEKSRTSLNNFLAPDEHDRLVGSVNTATQIIDEQSQDLSELRRQHIIDDFRHMKLASLLENFYTLQGKNERIKKFPLPRQYANLGRYFTIVFTVLLPFTLIPELLEVAHFGLLFVVPISALVGWVYVIMEVVGDYSENPFQGMVTDIPMMSLCRTIEIDLKEMLGETDLPPKIEAKNGILM